MKRRYFILIISLLSIVATVFAFTLLSNIYRGTIPNISIPEPLSIDNVEAPENLTIGEQFELIIYVRNPNPANIKGFLCVNFTLINPSETVSDTSITVNEAVYVNGVYKSMILETYVEGNSIIFKPFADDFYKITFEGNNATTIVKYRWFTLNIQCESLEYEVWVEG